MDTSEIITLFFGAAVAIAACVFLTGIAMSMTWDTPIIKIEVEVKLPDPIEEDFPE